MRFKRRPKLVEAFKVTPELSEHRIEMLFKVLGYSLISIEKENFKPFINSLERIKFTLLDSNYEKLAVYCFQNEYICLEDDVLVVFRKEDFESQFESIEPILTEIEKQSF
jgi:hypothetical protein